MHSSVQKLHSTRIHLHCTLHNRSIPQKKGHVFSGLLCPAWDAGKTSEGTPDEELICIKFNTARVDAGTNMNASRSRHRTRCRA